MATGVPKTKWSGNNSDPAQVNGLPEQPLDVSLSYEGKQAREEILATTPAATRVLWQSDKGENRLYYGDNLPILASFLNDDAVREKVRLVYIDPPFATKSVFQSRSQSDA